MGSIEIVITIVMLSVIAGLIVSSTIQRGGFKALEELEKKRIRLYTNPDGDTFPIAIDATNKPPATTAVTTIADIVIFVAVIDAIASIILGVWLIGSSLDTPRIMGQAISGFMAMPFCWGAAFLCQGVVVPSVMVLLAVVAKRIDRRTE